MNRFDSRWLIVAGSVLFAVNAQALINARESGENNYRTIVDRNPFGLKPAPPPAAPVATAEQKPKSDLKLTGITSFFGRRKAYFMSVEQKPQAQPEYYSLGVDEQHGGVEVLEIDEVGKSVRVRTEGVETLLTFDSHGVKPPNHQTAPAGGAATPRIPGAPAGAPGVAPTSGATLNTTAYNMPATMGTPPPANDGLVRPIPSRPTRLGQSTYQMDPALAARYGLQPNPSSNVPRPAPQPDMDPAEQVILMELQRSANPEIQMPPTPGLPGSTANQVPLPQLPIPPGGRR